MTTDITELAQREKFEAWVMTQICISRSTLEGLRTSDGYRNSTLSGSDYNLMWNLWKAAGDELVEALDKVQRHIARQEQILLNQDESLSIRRGELEAAHQRIAELESRTVKLPEPFKLAKSSSGLTYYYADEVDAALTAAGIKVEAE